MDHEPHPPTGAYLSGVDAIADVWTFLILREAFFGARKFGEFLEKLKIPRARLSERLKHLIAIGLLEKTSAGSSTGRAEYRLRRKGLATYPIALALIAWAQRWRAPQSTPVLTHRTCGRPLVTKLVCRNCGTTPLREDIEWPPLLPLNAANGPQSDVKRWRRKQSFAGVSARPDPALETLKAFGDRWSMLIMYGALKGDFRFGDAQRLLGLATNILSDRLKHLMAVGLLERMDAEGPRASYRATEAGRALLDVILVIRTWAVDHEEPGQGGWAKMVHASCGDDLTVDCVCLGCGDAVSPEDVSYAYAEPASVL